MKVPHLNNINKNNISQYAYNKNTPDVPIWMAMVARANETNAQITDEELLPRSLQ